jgi:hypothetical protein
MTEQTSEYVSQLERLLSENDVEFDHMDVEDSADAGCNPPQTVICIRPTCVRTHVVVGVE